MASNLWGMSPEYAMFPTIRLFGTPILSVFQVYLQLIQFHFEDAPVVSDLPFTFSLVRHVQRHYFA